VCGGVGWWGGGDVGSWELVVGRGMRVRAVGSRLCAVEVIVVVIGR
jgi:hypothetical protein